MTMALGDINLERTMKEIITESRKRRVLLCLDDKEIPQVEKILNEENIAYRKVKEQDTLEEGISILCKKMVEGFTCLKENISVYTSKELFHTIKKLAVLVINLKKRKFYTIIKS